LDISASVEVKQSKKFKMPHGRHFEKSKNRHISATVQLITTKFCIVTHTDLLMLLTVKILNGTNPRWRTCAIL